MQLLAAAHEACDRLSLSRVVSMAAPTNQIERTLLGYAQQEARDLARRTRWSALTTELVFTAVASEVQPNVIPGDFSRFVDGSFWNRSFRRPVQGPLSPQEWQNLKARGSVILPDRFMMRGVNLHIIPNPTAGAIFGLEYVSSYPVVDSAGVAKVQFTADDDQLRMAPHVLPLAIVCRYRQAMGFDYAEEKRDYETAVAEAMQSDGGRRTVDMSRNSDLVTTGLMVPEGNWTVPIL